jgi:GTP 3',8-cyclase
LVRIAGTLVRLGIRGVRVTGGEPLLRPDILDIVTALRALDPGIDLSLTTNGFRLARLAQGLKKAGLGRVNVSLDSLDPSAFKQLAGVEGLELVREGVAAALAAGLDPVKLNVVVVQGLNDTEIPAFARLTEDFALHVRFIELMPMGPAAQDLGPSRRVPLEDMMALAGPLEPVAPREKPNGFGPALVYRKPGAAGTLGFIAAVSGRFCETCNRVRVTSRGILLPCLAAENGFDLLPLMRAGASDYALEEAVREAVAQKPSGHAFGGCSGARVGAGLGMCGIGG